MHIGFGYGITVTMEQMTLDSPDGEDLWDVVEKDYPELQFSLAGDYWNKDIQNSVIFVKSSGTEIGYSTFAVISEEPELSCTTEGLEQLQKLQNTYGLSAIKPSWMIWRYSG